MTDKEDLLDEAADLGLDLPKRTTVEQIKNAIEERKIELDAEVKSEELAEDADAQPEEEEEEVEDDIDINVDEDSLPIEIKDGESMTVEEIADAQAKEIAGALAKAQEPDPIIYHCASCAFTGTVAEVDIHTEESHPPERIPETSEERFIRLQQGPYEAFKVLLPKDDDRTAREMMMEVPYQHVVRFATEKGLPAHGTQEEIVERFFRTDISKPPKLTKEDSRLVRYARFEYFLPEGGTIDLPKGAHIYDIHPGNQRHADGNTAGINIQVLKPIDE